MPVDTAAERAAMLLDFGFAIVYRVGGVGDGVPVQAIWDAQPTLLGLPPLTDGISSVGPTLLVLATSVPAPAAGDTFDLAGVEGIGTNSLHGLADTNPASSDGVYTRLHLHLLGPGLSGGEPGNPAIPL